MRFCLLGLLPLILLISCSSGPRRGPQRKLEFNTNAPARSVRTTGRETQKPAPGSSAKPSDRALVDISRSWGRVANVNESLKFVVIAFAVARMPAVNQQMTVYRNGQKMGVVKISGPAFDNNIAADLISGVARIGDEVRP